MTDNKTDGAAPKRTPAAKTSVAPKAAGASTPAAKTPVAQAPAAKVPAAKTPAAKAPAAKATVARTAPAAKVPPVVPPVQPVPVPAVAVAPAGWYPVAGTTQQRWWDGARWTEHVYPPAVAVAPAAPAGFAPGGVVPGGVAQIDALRAPDATKPGTVWFWLLAIGAPVLALLALIPTAVYENQLFDADLTDPAAISASIFSPAFLISWLSGLFIYAVCVVFALLDWRELKAHGVPRPFHWAWSFLVIVVGWPAVYMIGRAVVVKRRTGRGMAPLWVFIALEVVTFIVTMVVVIVAFTQFFGDLAANATDLG